MSILLEALKKSELQRQLGQTPTLHSNLEGQPQSKVSLNHWIPLALLLLSLSVMAWFGWRQFREPEPVDAVDVPAVVAQTAREPQARTMTESFPSDSEKLDQPSRPLAEANSRENKNDRARLNRSFNNFKTDAEQADTAAPPGDPAAAAERSPIAQAPIEDGAGVEPEVEADTRPEALATRPRQSRAGASSSKLQPHIAEPISYWELPQGVRDNLPEIKITVLVYSEKPAERFLLTNGQRMAEKDELQSGLVLDEIRRDGAIFLYRNYRFLVKG